MLKEDNEIIRNLFICSSPNEYKNILDDEAVKNLFHKVSKTKLKELTFNFILELRSQSYSIALPVVLIESVKAFHDGFIKPGVITTNEINFVKLFLTRLCREIPEITKDTSLIEKLQNKMINVSTEVKDLVEKQQPEFSFEQYWDSSLSEIAFRFSIFASQKTCFVSIYNAYEHFIDQLLFKVSGKIEYHQDKRKKLFIECFDSDIHKKCWDSPDINQIRIVRNRIIHHANKYSSELNDFEHFFGITDGYIDITPKENKFCIKTILTGINLIIDEYLRKY